MNEWTKLSLNFAWENTSPRPFLRRTKEKIRDAIPDKTPIIYGIPKMKIGKEPHDKDVLSKKQTSSWEEYDNEFSTKLL